MQTDLDVMLLINIRKPPIIKVWGPLITKLRCGGGQTSYLCHCQGTSYGSNSNHVST